MSGFIASNSYNITTENEISVILSHFDSQFILDVIRDNINQKFNIYQMNMPNVVNSFENYFKQLKMTYTNQDHINEIENVRIETYREIIEILAHEYGLEVNYDNIQDYYSIAYYLYEFLVSGFNEALVNFFTNYIMKEKNTLYDLLQLNDLKKNKDTTTIYNKKLYKNIKLAIINANLGYVMESLYGFDIEFSHILNVVYQDKNIVKFIESIVSPKFDFYKLAYVRMLQSQVGPILLTNIRIEINKQSINEEMNKIYL